ncbi:hypothetical protein FNV43_RR12165 [Rhamnella rubrinervis]|uniref:Uncharacterized protein n=1 Tax=Rhamnella rubrinervis TaxID=2594499 RepID=A0A8K0H7S4_9ROSA|nr:hypothetical protein FNV43_RR12165 [Rhamnella rubrinervis]
MTKNPIDVNQQWKYSNHMSKFWIPSPSLFSLTSLFYHQIKTAPLSALLRISLCEFVVRVHRLKIVRFIDTIITTIINTLAMASSDTQGPSLYNWHASKWFGLLLSMGLNEPLPQSIRCVPSNIDCLGSGAALCLRAVVDSDHWRIASDNMVTMVCIYVDAALRRCPNQTNAYMSLITALYVYPWRYDSQLQLIIEEMELRYFDGMDYVREAAFEACNILRKTPRMLVRSPSLNASLDVDGDDELVSSTNDLPGDSTSDLPGHSNVRVCSRRFILIVVCQVNFVLKLVEKDSMEDYERRRKP